MSEPGALEALVAQHRTFLAFLERRVGSRAFVRTMEHGAPSDDEGAVAWFYRLTPNNARVRLHRARRALKRQLQVSCGTCATHGCLDCACGGSRPTLTSHPG